MKPRREEIASQSALAMTHGSNTCNNTQIVSSRAALFATKRSPGCGQVCSEGMAFRRAGAMHFGSVLRLGRRNHLSRRNHAGQVQCTLEVRCTLAGEITLVGGIIQGRCNARRFALISAMHLGCDVPWQARS
jgi:hypothetical protein